MKNITKQKIENSLILSIFVVMIISIITSIYYSFYVRDFSVYFYSEIVKYNFIALIPILLFYWFFKNRSCIAKILFLITSLLIIIANTTITYQCKNIINNKYDYEINDARLLRKTAEMGNNKVYFYSNDCGFCKNITNLIVLYNHNNPLDRIYMYNTGAKYEFNDKVIESLKIDLVPMIIIVNKGDVHQKIYYSDIKEYLKN